MPRTPTTKSIWTRLLHSRKGNFLKGLADVRNHPEAMERFMLDGDDAFLAPPNVDKVPASTVAAWLPDVRGAVPRTDGLYYRESGDSTQYLRFHDDGFFSIASMMGSKPDRMYGYMEPFKEVGERGAWAHHEGRTSAFHRWREGMILYRLEGDSRFHVLSLYNGHSSVAEYEWWQTP